MSLFKKIFFAFSKKERVGFFAASLAAIASSIVVISFIVQESTIIIPTQGGTYTLGLVGQPEYINPVIAQTNTDLALSKLVYPSLGDIADHIDISADGKTWTVHLKNGLTWQDGQKLTSDDVLFTVASIQNPDTKSPLANAWQGILAGRVSELNLTFTLPASYAFFGDNMKGLYILPKHVFADIPPGNWHLSEAILQPVGSGPYRFMAYEKESDGFIASYQFNAWQEFWGPQPLIQEVKVKFFRNEKEVIDSFNTGGIDGFGGLSAEDVALIKRPHSLYSWDTTGYYAIFWNESKNLALQDPAVRKALDESADRNKLVQQPLLGYGTPEEGPIPQKAAYYHQTDAPAFSPEDASTTLTDAGWLVQSSTNARAKIMQKTSIPLNIALTVPDIDFLVATAEALAAQWQTIGIHTTIATDTPINVAALNINNRAYEGVLFGNVLGPSSDLYSFWDSSQRFSPGLNLALYNNPGVDTLIQKTRQGTAEASRTAEFAQAQQNIINDHPALFLYSPQYLFVSNKSTQGITTGLLIDPSDISRQITGWYLHTARVLKSSTQKTQY